MPAPARDTKPSDDRTKDERKAARDRADRAHKAWTSRDHDGPVAVRTGAGDVIVERVEFYEQDDIAWVEVWVGGETERADPHYRIFNPPLLASDPLGDVEVRGMRFRLDPMAAIAEAIGRNGGAKKRGRS